LPEDQIKAVQDKSANEFYLSTVATLVPSCGVVSIRNLMTTGDSYIFLKTNL